MSLNLRLPLPTLVWVNVFRCYLDCSYLVLFISLRTKLDGLVLRYQIRSVILLLIWRTWNIQQLRTSGRLWTDQGILEIEGFNHSIENYGTSGSIRDAEAMRVTYYCDNKHTTAEAPKQEHMGH